MKNYREILEVYMSKSLSRDLDASRTKQVYKFAIMVDGFEEEKTKTKKSANTKRSKWIKFYKRNNYTTQEEAEAAVVIKDLK